jgi:predicted ATPase
MITRVEALNYRCFPRVSQPLGAFQLLVGPNGSGKSAFLDILTFLANLTWGGLQATVSRRTERFRDLVFARTTSGNSQPDQYIELAVEFRVPDYISGGDQPPDHFRVRYEVKVGPRGSSTDNDPVILSERLTYHPDAHSIAGKESKTVAGIAHAEGDNQRHLLLCRNEEGLATLSPSPNSINPDPNSVSIPFDTDISALGNIPEDEELFPIAAWIMDILRSRVTSIRLEAIALRKPIFRGAMNHFVEDGTGVSHWIRSLGRHRGERFDAWLKHVQTAFPDIRFIRVVVRPEDQHQYLVVQYRDGLELPAWALSEGTLRLLALTLLPYIASGNQMFLVENPESGLHPRNIETVVQSLTSIYDEQTLIETHSPAFLYDRTPESLLCFRKHNRGFPEVVRGNLHPCLSDWDGEPDLGTLFAAGALE